MRRLFFILCLPLLCALTVSGQQMRTVFAEMPDSVLPLLTKNNRLDCIDFKDNRMEALVENALGGRSQMLELTDNFCKIRLTEASEVSLKLLPAADTTRIVCMVHTCRMPAAESTVRFYTSDWRPLPVADRFDWPADEACWVVCDTYDAARMEEVRKLVDIPVRYALLEAGTNDLRIGLSLEALTADDRKKVEPFMNSGLVLKWKDGRYVKP